MSLETISFSNVPLVIKNCIDWDVLKWSIDDWDALLNNPSAKYPFRTGSFSCSVNPQWERSCQVTNMTFTNFFEKFKGDHNLQNWWYFGYKHIEEWLKEKAEKMDINWENFGFPGKTAKDSTLWIGTKGAHTPCHFDTYGCNLVAQLYGRKRWCLFPPSETENLQPTRIPYEESSVYSNLNFFCGCSDVSAIKEVYVVDLEPGDVLFVPFHWWHYVENLSSAISVNMWIHNEHDVSLTEESLVKYFMSSVCKSLSAEDAKCILNPNEDDLPTFNEINNLAELSFCLKQCKERETKQSCNNSIKDKYRLDKITPEKFSEYLKCKGQGICNSGVGENNNTLRNNVINAFCDPEIITLIRKKLQKTHLS